MSVEELVGRLHGLADTFERRRAKLEANPPEGIALGSREHRVGLEALADDAHFLHTLADLLEHRAITPAHSETARWAIESIAGELRERP